MAKKLKSRRKRSAASAKSGRAFLLRLIGISIICIVLLKHTFILFIAGMLPAIIAAIVDSSKSKHIFKAVSAFNLSGVAPYVAEAVGKNNSIDSVQQLMSQPQVWLFMYGAASIGWGMIKFSPIVIKMLMAHFSGNKASKIEAEQKKLIDEWGTEIKSNAG